MLFRSPLSQEHVRFEGHAIEVRLCAEDANQGFVPQSGTMALWKTPAGLRVEDALQSGAEIPPFYDSMVAKFISHGRTRDEARRKLSAGLQDTVALGITTNQAFLQRCLELPVFAEGGATTAFIAQHQEALLATDSAVQGRAEALAAVLLYETGGDRRHGPPVRRLTHTLPISLRFDIGGRALNASIAVTRDRSFNVSIAEESFAIDLVELAEASVRFVCDGVQEKAAFHRDGPTLWLHYRGVPVRVEDTTRSASVRQGEAAGDGKLRASMNGRVVAVMVGIGDTVQAGQPIFTLEAMKMEHVHPAPIAGTVTALHVAIGDQIAASRIVAEIEAVAMP